MKKHIPNSITLLNLAFGIIAVIFASQNELEYAAYFVTIGIVFDFFDGLAARLLNAQSEIGLQLDSLADMVTSGVAPGIIMFQLLRRSDSDWVLKDFLSNINEIEYLPFLGIILSLAAAYRLAKFNVDDRQDHDFIGLPTPALSLFVISLPLITLYSKHEWGMNMVNNSLFLIATTILGSILMNSGLKLFSLKFNDYSFRNNKVKYLFLIMALLLLIGLQITAIPIIIILYILLSVGNNLFAKN